MNASISKFLSGRSQFFYLSKMAVYAMYVSLFTNRPSNNNSINRTIAVKSEAWSSIGRDDLVKQIASFFFRYRLAKYGHHTWKRRVSIVVHIGEIFCCFGGVKEPSREYHSPRWSSLSLSFSIDRRRGLLPPFVRSWGARRGG